MPAGTLSSVRQRGASARCRGASRTSSRARSQGGIVFSFSRISRSIGVLAVVAAFTAVSLTALVPSAEAHERRQVGDLTFVVGFLNEPAYLEEANGASVRVTRADGTPVEGLQQSLKVEVTSGADKRTFDL